ncbi:MAG: hypothetical protein CMG66_03795 [Candidatus Marinimicrobia bacterium]|nr:hypothetical protein [Candidatus Neomarinimicrobiota bacterium]|tara:strand:- start:837 stop:4382 length:3546 start_codon:yes stop_codon:yes gene_type:complete
MFNKRKETTYLYFAFLSIIILIFSSCSSEYSQIRNEKKLYKEEKKKERKEKTKNRRIQRNSKNEFKAYYNSYYLAKIKFRDALEEASVHQNSSNTRSNNSVKLFDDAIKYSNVVLDDFYNTDYWLDAAYIKARASYSKNIFSAASYYFNEIIKNKNNPYYYDSLVRMGFISLRLNDSKKLLSILEELDSSIDSFNSNIKKLDKKNPYKFIQNDLLQVESNYYILKAEEALYSNSPISEVEYYYKLAINSSIDKSKTEYLYSILLSIFESSNDILKVLEYTDKVISLNKLNKDDISSDLYLKDWFDLNRSLGLHSNIYKHIDSLYKESSNIKDKLYLLLERAKTYFYDENIELAFTEFNKLVQDYEEDLLLYKDYFSEVYYYLGQIYLKSKYDYKLALNYFDLSIEKKSKDNPSINKSKSLNDYLELYDQYLVANASNVKLTASDSLVVNEINVESGNNEFYIPVPDDYSYNSDNVDTLLFNMGSILYFDLDMKDEALNKFEFLYNGYTDSYLIPQVIKILNEIDPSIDWRRKFLGDLKVFSKNKNEVIDNSLIDSRNKAFKAMNSSIQEALNLFEINFDRYDDLNSLYMIAFIYDFYLKDPYQAVTFYNKYLEHAAADNINVVTNRLRSIETVLNDEINITKQRIAYSNSLQYLNYNSLISKDSILVSLSDCQKGESIKLKDKCKAFENVIDFLSPEELLDTLSVNLIGKWSNNKSMDLQIFDVAMTLYANIQDNELTAKYCKILIDYYADSDIINDVYLLLDKVEPNSDWSLVISNAIYEDFLEIEKFSPKTGLDIVNASLQKPKPATLSSENIFYKVYKDSLIQYQDSAVYSLKYNSNIFSDNRNLGEKFLISKLNTKEVRYTVDKNSIIKWDLNYSRSQEISEDDYYFDNNLKVIQESISPETKNYRYNINDTASECYYLEESYSCYEVRAIPNKDGFYKTIWFLELEDNVFLRIKENISNINQELLFKNEFKYKKIDSFYIVDKIKKIDLNKEYITILDVNEIQVNNGILLEDLMPKNNIKVKDFNIQDLNQKLMNLIDMNNVLFPDLEDINDDSNKNLFDYSQSVNQYFYFVETATINGVELTDKDMIVAYNDDVVVGARQYVLEGRIDVPLMGYDNSSENTKISTKGYCEVGDIPIIKVHRDNGEVIDMDVILIDDDGTLGFQSIGHVYVILQKD